MRMEMQLGQRLELKLKLAPQIIQSIEILQMNVTDLAQYVDEQMLENPAMELESELKEQIPAEDPDEAQVSPEIEALVEPGDDTREALAHELDRLASLDEDYKAFSGGRRSFGDGKDKKLEAMLNTPERDETLQEHLLAQLKVWPGLTPRQFEIGQFIVYNLDESGYLRTDTDADPAHGEELAHDAPDVPPWALDLLNSRELSQDFCNGIEVEPPAQLGEVEEVLHAIQALEPVGVGARGLKECLLIQIGMADEYSLERHIIRDHLEDVLKNRLPRIARATGEPIELINEAIRYLRVLNPQPGSTFARTCTQYVTPDITVRQVSGEWRVTLEDAYVPHIRISPHYRNMLQDKGDDPKVYEYVKRKIDAAKQIMEAIEQRQQTLRRIAEHMVAYQRSFFEIGVDALKPLKMQYIADLVGVHVSTVSRAISGKYMQTPRGIFSLRYFYKGGATTDDGRELSVVAIQEKVKAIVRAEDSGKPLSDEDIAKKLKSHGLDVARRTITKYRKKLGIPSSRQRRKFV